MKKQAVFFVVLIIFVLSLTACLKGLPDNTMISTYTEVDHSETKVTTSTPTPVPNEPITLIEESENIKVVTGWDNTMLLSSSAVVELNGKLERAEFSENKNDAAMLLDCNGEGIGRLVFFDGENAKEIASDVQCFRISADGAKLAYLSVNDNMQELFVYHCDSGSNELVANEAGEQFALSPYGKAIAYTRKMSSEDGNERTTFTLIFGEQETLIDSGANPIALTDDAKLLYAITYDSEESSVNSEPVLLVYYEGVPESLGAISTDQSLNKRLRLLFNQDCSQVIYSNQSGLYLSENGGRPILLDSLAYLCENDYSIKADEYLLQKNPHSNNDDRKLRYYLAYSGADYLQHVLLMLDYQDSIDSCLWYLSEELEGVKVSDIRSDDRYHQAGLSVLANNWNGQDWILIYIENATLALDDERSNDLNKREILVDGTEFLLSSDKTIYCEFYQEIAGAEKVVLAAIFPEKEPIFISEESVSGMWRYVRDEQPDLIYFTQGITFSTEYDEDEQLHVNTYYDDLYVIEDRPGAKPALVAKRVCNVNSGEFGINYCQLDEIAPEFKQWLTLGSDETAPYSEVELYDRTVLYFSRGGLPFEPVAEVKVRHLFGG